MYKGYIIECPSMCDLFWQFVRIKYPDVPEELHEMSSASLTKLNKHLSAINTYLRELANSEDVQFSDIDNFIDYVLNDYPSHIDRDVLDAYLSNLDGIIHIVTSSLNEELVVLDRFGSTAVIME